MYAIFTMRKMHLISRISDIQYKLMQLSQKLSDLALFGSNIQDGMITPDEFANSPASLFLPHMQFGNYAMMQAIPQAQFQMQMYQQYQAQMGNASALTPQVEHFMFNSFLKQSLESVAKGTLKRIAAEEKKIQMEKARYEQQLKAMQAEVESCDRAEEQGIKNATPKYA